MKEVNERVPMILRGKQSEPRIKVIDNGALYISTNAINLTLAN